MSKMGYFNKLMKDSDRKFIFKIIIELIHCFIIEKETPYYYFQNLLHKKNSPNYRQFIGNKKRGNIIDDFYFTGDFHRLEDKNTFDKVMKKSNVKSTNSLAYTENRKLLYSDKAFEIDDLEALKKSISIIITENKLTELFIKPLDGIGGSTTFKIHSNSDKKIEDLFEAMKKTDFIIQENLIQHELLDQIYSNSINTVRVHTFRHDSEVEIVSSIMRFGVGNNIVDNGGLFVPVYDWKLEKYGYSLFKKGGGRFVKHPDTNFAFENFEIPFVKEIENLIKKAASLFEKDFIGWDIAITNEGPVIIEGNHNPHFFMLQIGCKGIKNHPQYSKIFSDYIE